MVCSSHSWEVLHRRRKEVLHRRAADNDASLEDALTNDGLDLPVAVNITDYNNSTEANATDSIKLENTTNTTAAVNTQIPSLSPSETTHPTQNKKSTESSASPSIAPSITSMPTIPDLSPTSNPIQSTPAPTYGLLPIQSINILVMTDVHSWAQGHGRHEPSLNADYGDVLSFYQRLKSQITATTLPDGTTPDLYFVMNGDFVHGTLIGQNPPVALSGIIERMPYDIVTVGNHDIQNDETVKELTRAGGLVDLWGERLVTSNVRIKGNSDGGDKIDDLLEPIGNNYRFLHGNQGTVLALGFLYNYEESSVTVETVQDVIKQTWFTSLFSIPQPTDFDAILVMAHMTFNDELITLLHDKIRELVGKSMVIQFITGHTHVRSYLELDEYSVSFEAGRYLDTIGFVSFDAKQGNFEHVFVNANKASIAQSLGMSVDEYPTQDGKDLSEYINRTYEHAGANQILGCSPIRYRADGYLNETDSLLTLYLKEVMPSSFLRKYTIPGSIHSKHINNVIIQRLDWFVRYDLFAGPITANDLVAVIPLDYTIVPVSNSIKGKDILAIKEAWSNNETFLDNTTNIIGILLPDAGYEIDSTAKYDLFTLSKFDTSISKIMSDLKVDTLTTSHPVYNGEKTLRTMWTDYIKKHWPYDGNSCECITDNTCGNFTGLDTGAPGSFPWDKQSSSGHGSPQVSHPSRPNPSIPGNSEGGNKSHNSQGNGSQASNSSHRLIFIAIIGLAAIFYVMRKRRQGGYSTAREVTRSNDLELRVTPPPGHGSVVPPAGYGNMNPQPGGYSSPQFSRGNYV